MEKPENAEDLHKVFETILNIKTSIKDENVNIRQLKLLLYIIQIMN
jgi:hypothetical protein